MVSLLYNNYIHTHVHCIKSTIDLNKPFQIHILWITNLKQYNNTYNNIHIPGESQNIGWDMFEMFSGIFLNYYFYLFISSIFYKEIYKIRYF